MRWDWRRGAGGVGVLPSKLCLLCQAVACAAGPVHYILPSSDAKSGLAQQENHFPNLSSGCPSDILRLVCCFVFGLRVIRVQECILALASCGLGRIIGRNMA